MVVNHKRGRTLAWISVKREHNVFLSRIKNLCVHFSFISPWEAILFSIMLPFPKSTSNKDPDKQMPHYFIPTVNMVPSCWPFL